jgi:hypothetical protein
MGSPLVKLNGRTGERVFTKRESGEDRRRAVVRAWSTTLGDQLPAPGGVGNQAASVTYSGPSVTAVDSRPSLWMTRYCTQHF